MGSLAVRTTTEVFVAPCACVPRATSSPITTMRVAAAVCQLGLVAIGVALLAAGAAGWVLGQVAPWLLGAGREVLSLTPLATFGRLTAGED